MYSANSGKECLDWVDFYSRTITSSREKMFDVSLDSPDTYCRSKTSSVCPPKVFNLVFLCPIYITISSCNIHTIATCWIRYIGK